MRDALTFKADGLLLHGTSHINPGAGDLGILFLNSGSLPRSSRGDLNVHLADSLADRGFKCFRIDLPGLGDSQGEIPQEYVEFYELVQEGTYAEPVVRIERELRRTYGLTGVVLVGICGGAQTSVFAAAKDHGDGVAGLVLLDMPFFLYRRSNPAAQDQGDHSLGSRIFTRILGVKARMHDWVLAQKWEPLATKVYNRLKRITNRTRAGSMPPNTNLALLRTLSSLLDQEIPVLLITARSPIPEPPSFDYIGYLGGPVGEKLTHVEIHRTTHSFVENGGAEAVLKAISDWLVRISPSP